MDAGGDERYASRPRYRAEDLVYEAWEAAGERRVALARVALAREALALWPDCADAYVLLAQAASSLDGARELLERGVAAGFVYAKALAAFRCGGDDAGARRLRAEARELNPHIPVYLTGRKKLPVPRPAYTVFGEESEAVDYAAGGGELWASVPGALAWLESLGIGHEALRKRVRQAEADGGLTQGNAAGRAGPAQPCGCRGERTIPRDIERHKGMRLAMSAGDRSVRMPSSRTHSLR
jgi:hypothetical protein